MPILKQNTKQWFGQRQKWTGEIRDNGWTPKHFGLMIHMYNNIHIAVCCETCCEHVISLYLKQGNRRDIVKIATPLKGFLSFVNCSDVRCQRQLICKSLEQIHNLVQGVYFPGPTDSTFFLLFKLCLLL